MGKGLCSGDKSVLGLMANFADGFAKTMSKAKNVIKSMFQGVSASEDQQKVR